MRRQLDVVGGAACKATVSTVTESSLWAAIEKARGEFLAADAKPEGWFTKEKYQEHMGLSDTTARRELNALVAAGKLQTKLAREKGHLVRCFGLP